MKLITRDTDYAVRAIMYIAGSEKPIVSTAELMEKLKLPRPFLRKILQVLVKNRILKSAKGNSGGFMLDLSPEKIFVSDLIKIFQGDMSFSDCLFRKKLCHNRDKCPLRNEIKDIEDYTVKRLQAVNIKYLLEKI
jgi:Rrf2 family protein